jgi:hypothetical protein
VEDCGEYCRSPVIRAIWYKTATRSFYQIGSAILYFFRAEQG